MFWSFWAIPEYGAAVYRAYVKGAVPEAYAIVPRANSAASDLWCSCS
jgi:hypothetical protein